MKKLLSIIALLAVCLTIQAKIPVYVWVSWNNNTTTAKTLKRDFKQWKKYGVVGVCLNAGMDSARIATASRIAHQLGLEYHAWIPTMTNGTCPESWYTVNRLGQNAKTNPAYVPHYTTLDPHNPNVHRYMKEQLTRIARIKDVDYIQLDYIRYADVILAKGLWNKYSLVMNGEYATADYCYCDDCVNDFKQNTGIDIRQYTDPSKVEAWAQFRCDNVTNLVNDIADAVHNAGKKISADVFPGPDSHARWMVRQEWQKWNLDAVFPMNYNDFYLEPASWLKPITKEEVESVAGRFPVYSGLFICKDWQHKASVVDPEYSGLLPSEIQEAVLGSMESGAKGICLFTPNSMTPEHWAELQKVIK